MAIEVFNRYEHKYLLDADTYRKVLPVIREHMEMDAYNIGGKPYTIANIYYDTPDDYLIRRSLESPAYKEKLRLRSYGVPKGEDTVYLEIKKKYAGLVNKRRSALHLAEAYDFADTGKAPQENDYMNPQVVKEITYFLSRYHLEPKVYIAYDRVAFFEKDNPDLRISFDSGIRSRRYDLHLESGDHGTLLLPNSLYLMEIKTALAKPLWLTRLLSEHALRRSSFSKYGTEFQNQLLASRLPAVI